MNNSSSSTKEKKAQVIMICVDTSYWMESTKSPMFKDQVEAITLYCNEKLKSHSLVGVCGTADEALHFLSPPTRQLNVILDAINHALTIGGHLRLLRAASNAYSAWMLGLRPTRIVFFAGGRLYLELHHARMLGTKLNRLNVACDVISFGDPYVYKKKFFDSFAHYNGNCNVCYVPPESSVCEALSRSQIIIPRVGGGSSLPPSPSLSVQHDKTKKIDIYVKAPTDSADDKTDCIFCQRVLLTLQEKEVPYETTFIDLDKTGWFDETRTLPLISFDNVTWFSNSDFIVEMIEEKYPEPSLVTRPHFAYLGLKILPKLAEFLKSKNETVENDASKQALLDELEELEVHLSENGPYVNGEKITAVDLSLATKLYHLEHACWHYKNWAVPDDLTAVQQYKKLLFDRDSFENTKPRPQNVIEGWCQRLSLCK